MKTPSKKLLGALVLIATTTIGQAYAGTIIKDKSIESTKKQTTNRTLVNTKQQSKTIKTTPISSIKNNAMQTVNTKVPVVNINRVGTTPATSAIANQPSIKNGLKARLSKKNIGKQFNNPKALNGSKRLNPIEAFGAANGAVNGAPTVPNTGRPSIIGQHGVTGNGVSEQQGNYSANNRFAPVTIETRQGGLSTITNLENGKEILVHTPEGGLPQGTGALWRSGDMYIFEADGVNTYIPVAETDQAQSSNSGNKPAGSTPGVKPIGSNTGGKDTSSGGEDTSGSGKDTSGGGKDTSGGGKDTSGGGKDTSGDGKDTDTGGKDTDTGGEDTDTGGEDTDTGGEGEDTTKRGANGSNYNQHDSGNVVGDFMGNKTGEKKHVESAQPKSGGEDHGSNPVTQPGPEGSSNSVSGYIPTVGDGSDSGNTGPKNNLRTNPYISPAERKSAVVNPDRFEEQGDEINHAVGTLEDIGHAVNPRR
jgi:hypothetical protein